MTPGLTRRASKIGQARFVAGGDVGGNERRRRSGLERQLLEHARERQRHAGWRMRVGLVEIRCAGRDSRREPEPRALALVGEGAERSEVEIVLRRNLLQARIQHRLEPGARQRVGLDRRAKRERDRIAGRFIRPFAGDGFAPPGEPDRRQIGIARAPQRMPDFRVERSERGKTAAGALVRIERAEPLIAGVSAGERGAMLGSVRERVGAPRGRRAFTAWG